MDYHLFKKATKSTADYLALNTYRWDFAHLLLLFSARDILAQSPGVKIFNLN